MVRAKLSVQIEESLADAQSLHRKAETVEFAYGLAVVCWSYSCVGSFRRGEDEEQRLLSLEGAEITALCAEPDVTGTTGIPYLESGDFHSALFRRRSTGQHADDSFIALGHNLQFKHCLLSGRMSQCRIESIEIQIFVTDNRTWSIVDYRTVALPEAG